MRTLSWLNIVVALQVALGFMGCKAPTMVPSATPTALDMPGRALVLGRVLVYRGGQQQPVQPAATGGEEGTLMVVFANLSLNQKFALDIDNEEGGVEVLLPPGRYRVALRYSTWLSGTPAHFELTDVGTAYYMGTLRVDLFCRWSVRGTWARIFGGDVPQSDSDFTVLDEWQWAQATLRTVTSLPVPVQKRLMQLGDTD